MVFENPLSLIEFGLNTIFMLSASIILFVFLNRFEGNVQYTKHNISGIVLISLGIIFHLLGDLSRQLLVGSNIYEMWLKYFILGFLSFAVVIFIFGTALILYHITPERRKSEIKLFGAIFLIIGLIDIIFQISLFFASDEFVVLSMSPTRFHLFYLTIEMTILILIYIVLFLRARRSVSKIVGARYRIIALNAIAYDFVILINSLISLELIDYDQFTTFLINFVLHSIVIGTLYLLVIFPPWYQKLIGINR